MCHISYVTCHIYFFFLKLAELIRGGSFINRAYLEYEKYKNKCNTLTWYWCLLNSHWHLAQTLPLLTHQYINISIFLITYNPLVEYIKRFKETQGYKIKETAVITTPFADDFNLTSSNNKLNQKFIFALTSVFLSNLYYRKIHQINA